MKRPQISCRKCEGSGAVDLEDSLWNTLQVLAKLKRATAPEIFEQSQGENAFIKVTAINRRLEDLRALNLVEREREGAVWKYFVKEKA